MHKFQRKNEEASKEDPERRNPCVSEKCRPEKSGMRDILNTCIASYGKKETCKRSNDTPKESEEKMRERWKKESKSKSNECKKDPVYKSKCKTDCVVDFVSFH